MMPGGHESYRPYTLCMPAHHDRLAPDVPRASARPCLAARRVSECPPVKCCSSWLSRLRWRLRLVATAVRQQACHPAASITALPRSPPLDPLFSPHLQIIARGFIFDRGSYLRDKWNWLDFFVVCVGYISFLPSVSNVSALRTFRIFRPLRTLTAVPSLRVPLGAVLSSMPRFGLVLFLVLFIFFCFGIVGLELWGGVVANFCHFDNSAVPPNLSASVLSAIATGFQPMSLCVLFALPLIQLHPRCAYAGSYCAAAPCFTLTHIRTQSPGHPFSILPWTRPLVCAPAALSARMAWTHGGSGAPSRPAGFATPVPGSYTLLMEALPGMRTEQRCQPYSGRGCVRGRELLTVAAT
jgi:hypothetical protein